MMKTKISSMFVILLWGLSSHLMASHEVFKDIRLDRMENSHMLPKKETIERLLFEIWDSEFIAKTCLLELEITNNAYGISDPQEIYSNGFTRRAFFIKEEGESDQIFLSKRLFQGVDYKPNKGMYIRAMDERIKSTLLHELFHDFWYNVLTEDERESFSREAVKFFERLEISAAHSARIDLTLEREVEALKVPDQDVYEELSIRKRNYSDSKFFGTEMFSLLAQLAFQDDYPIPESFRPFYNGIISDMSSIKACQC